MQSYHECCIIYVAVFSCLTVYSGAKSRRTGGHEGQQDVKTSPSYLSVRTSTSLHCPRVAPFLQKTPVACFE
jgi:hypothetical protein